MMLENISNYLTYYKKSKLKVGASLCLSFLQAISLIPVAILIQRIFDVALPEKNGTLLMMDLGIMFLLFCVNAVAILWNRALSLGVIKSVIGNVRQALVFQIMQLSRQYYSGADIDAVHAKIVNDSERVDCMTSALLTQFFPGILIVAGLSCFLIYENAVLFLVVACAMPLLYIIAKLLGKKVKKQIRQFHSDFSNFSKGVLFSLKFNELIKLSTAESFEMDRQRQNIQSLRFSSQKMAWLCTAYTIIQSNILVVSGIVVLLVGGFQAVSGSATVGSLLSFYVALNLLSASASGVINALPAIIEGKESLDSLAPLLKKNDEAKKDADALKTFAKEITFENVSFHHADSHFTVKNVNFSVKKNELFGIFGASGSGKSTIINLLLGFYEPNGGRIAVDENAINGTDLIAYRKQIGVLPQDLLIFSGTIRENLTYGLDDVDAGWMETVCRYCNIHEHIESLEKKYDSEIGEHGIKLSGGQKQRIAIARAVLRNPKILVLDEPDNNLDEHMFLDILNNIRKLPLTVIVISHNRDLYRHFDSVYEMIP